MLYIQELSSFDIYGNPIGYRDHTDADFANVPPGLTMWSVSFEVKMAGEVVDYDRPYSLKVEADSTTAVEGVDYDLEDNEFMIKAGRHPGEGCHPILCHGKRVLQMSRGMGQLGPQ